MNGPGMRPPRLRLTRRGELVATVLGTGAAALLVDVFLWLVVPSGGAR